MECSFPDELAAIAEASKHLTPATLRAEVAKLPAAVPVFLYHMKPPDGGPPRLAGRRVRRRTDPASQRQRRARLLTRGPDEVAREGEECDRGTGRQPFFVLARARAIPFCPVSENQESANAFRPSGRNVRAFSYAAPGGPA